MIVPTVLGLGSGLGRGMGSSGEDLLAQVVYQHSGTVAPDDVCPCVCDRGLPHLELVSRKPGSEEEERFAGSGKGLRP